MKPGVFVTGTDTGVGKTLASGALIQALVDRGVPVSAMKPVAAGWDETEGNANSDTLALMSAAGLGPEWLADVTPFLFREAIAPHIAAAREGRRIDLAEILAARSRLLARAPFLVVEGVGGWQVPLGPEFDTVDLARSLGLPVVLVVGLRLGCLNHALLTADAVNAAGLELAGWIANTIDPAMPVLAENLATLRERIRAPLLGHFPHRPGVSARELASHLDISALLA